MAEPAGVLEFTGPRRLSVPVESADRTAVLRQRYRQPRPLTGAEATVRQGWH